MSSEVITLPSDRVAARSVHDISQATAVEQARAVAEVAAAVRVAQDNPRDEGRAVERMRRACGQRALADKGFYSLPRAGGRVEGTTVHVAREIAGCWGNIDYGVRELRRDDDNGVSEMQAWAWDQENNVRSSRSFVVPHAIMAGKGADKKRKALTDLGDIANNNNSVAARAVRETINTVLPVWYVSEAEALLTKTLQGAGDGKPLPQQVAEAVSHFADTFSVTKAQLEKWADRKTTQWTAQDVAALRVLATELSRGEKRVQDEFGAQQVTAEEITRKPGEPAALPDPHDPNDPWAKGDAS